MTYSERGGIKLLEMGSLSQCYLLSVGCHFLNLNPFLMFSLTSLLPIHVLSLHLHPASSRVFNV